MREKQVYLWQSSTDQDEVQRCWFHDLSHWHNNKLALALRHERYDQGSDTGQHCHEDFYALYIVRSGRGIHIISGHPYGIARGDIYLMPIGAVHAYRDYHTLAIDALYFQPHIFLPEELAALRELVGFWHLLITFEEQIGSTHPPEQLEHRLHLSPERQYLLDEMLDELNTEYSSTRLASTLLTRGLFFRLLVRLAYWQSEYTQEQVKQHSSVQGLEGEKQALYALGMSGVLRICEEHFHEPLSVPQLASHLFLSPSRFSELFLREVGMSPATYIRRLRLERAQTLLRSSTLTCTEIAHQVGFRDSAQLSRAFRDLFHLSPSEYRASFRPASRSG